ncbi:MAG: hypothetical protein QXZ70_00645 [Candidatus Bathyarchaeia archaeon]
MLGVLNREDSEERLREEFGKLGVRIIPFRDILKEIHFKGTAKDQTGRFLQLIASQLTDEARKNLLKG